LACLTFTSMVIFRDEIISSNGKKVLGGKQRKNNSFRRIFIFFNFHVFIYCKLFNLFKNEGFWKFTKFFP
jgi:hypothetical protein